MTTTSNKDTSQATLPGRLGHPDLELRTDPRSDPRMVAALAAFGMDTAAAPPPMDSSAPREPCLSSARRPRPASRHYSTA
jgi:acetyl esterase